MSPRPSVVSIPDYLQSQITILNIATKGISANLLQAGSKRKRTKAQIAAEKAEAEREEMQKAAKLA